MGVPERYNEAISDPQVHHVHDSRVAAISQTLTHAPVSVNNVEIVKFHFGKSDHDIIDPVDICGGVISQS